MPYLSTHVVPWCVHQYIHDVQEELYADYNVFFYHYTREDQSKSEQVQRARLKAANKPQVLFSPSLFLSNITLTLT